MTVKTIEAGRNAKLDAYLQKPPRFRGLGSDVIADHRQLTCDRNVKPAKPEPKVLASKTEGRVEDVIAKLRNHEKKRGDAAIDMACMNACACSGRELGAGAKAVFTVSGGRG